MDFINQIEVAGEGEEGGRRKEVGGEDATRDCRVWDCKSLINSPLLLRAEMGRASFIRGRTSLGKLIASLLALLPFSLSLYE